MKIEDGQKRGWFWIENGIFDYGIANQIGSSALIIYFALCRHANKEGKSFPSVKKLQFETGLSNKIIANSIDTLKRYNLLEVQREKHQHNIYTIKIVDKYIYLNNKKKILNVESTSAQQQVKNLHEAGVDSTPEQVKNLHEAGVDSTHKGNSLKEIKLKETLLRIPLYNPPKRNTEVTKEKKEDNHQAKEIINYLNKATGRQFKYTTSHQRYIEARFKEGFTANELKLIINFKARQWIDNPKMSQYLRPSTLFGNKADDYLQAALQAGGNPEDPEAIVGNTNTNNSMENTTKKRDYYYAKDQPNYQPRRIPQTPWEKTEAAFKRVSQSTHTIDESGNPINDFNNDDYAF